MLVEDTSTSTTKRSVISRLRQRWRTASAIEGVLLGLLIGLCSWQLGFTSLLRFTLLEDFLVLPSLVGIVLAHTPLRRLLRIFAIGIIIGLFAVGYTPMVKLLFSGLEQRESPKPAPAIVVLSASLLSDGSLSAATQARVLKGYELLRQGYSDTLILTETTIPPGSQVPAILRQMGALDLHYTVISAGPARDTHDEALGVAHLARERGWSEVILVTHSWHTRRASLTFAKAGVKTIPVPCVENEYDSHALSNPGSRLAAFRDWLHETVGIQVYRMRGWL